jgi:predicted dehydrogenase
LTLNHATVPPHPLGERTPPTGIAIVGCGYVADFYLATLPNYRDLVVRGCFDRVTERAAAFGTHHQLHRYRSMAALLADDQVDLVINLTNPSSHYEVSRQCLLAGKHVYSEKPLAESMTEATELVELAEEFGLMLGSAPCSLLGESAQTLWHALRSGAIGQPRLVYADLDDGAIHQMPFRSWISQSGAPWPFLDEFTVGPTLEHAAYYVTWLTAFFGPVGEVVCLADRVMPDKLGVSSDRVFAPDFSCACLRFASGVVARLTCGTVAPENHTLQIVGDRGLLSVTECWDYGAPVTLQRLAPRSATRHHYLAPPEIYPPVRSANYPHRYVDTHDMDFARGVADVAAAVHGTGEARLSARHSLHVLEIILAINNSVNQPGTVRITSRFDPIQPAGWAADERQPALV